MNTNEDIVIRMGRVIGVLMGSLFFLGATGSAAAAETRELTVLTYNIHHGEGSDGKIDLERIARIITGKKPDFVALQEVDKGTRRSGGVDQAKELGRLTGMSFVFGRAIDHQGGEYGQAILSRWAIKEHTVHNLPQREGREQRIAVVAKIDGPVGGLIFASTHLDHQIESIRVEQAGALNRIFETNDATVAILAGDFNATPESGSMKLLLEQWDDSAQAMAAPTIPAENPTRRIDYILTRPKERWDVVQSEVLAEPVVSDHRPVLAILRAVLAVYRPEDLNEGQRKVLDEWTHGLKTRNSVADLGRLKDSLKRWDDLFIEPAPAEMKPVFTILKGRVKERIMELETESAKEK
jgi:endonuclease/exonuclease/phosphatase family metal-dependent hydrolase